MLIAESPLTIRELMQMSRYVQDVRLTFFSPVEEGEDVFLPILRWKADRTEDNDSTQPDSISSLAAKLRGGSHKAKKVMSPLERSLCDSHHHDPHTHTEDFWFEALDGFDG